MDIKYGYSKAKYAGDGVTANRAVPFPYLNKLDVQHAAYVTATGQNVSPSYTFTWINANTVQFSPIPPVGVEVWLERNSSIRGQLVDYANGAGVTERDLDTAYLQSMYIAQEALDEAGLRTGNASSLDGLVALAQSASTSAAGYASTAAGSASSSATSAASAAASAASAATSASDAATSAASAAASVTAAVSDKLSKSANLSDLANVATARTNLGLGALALQASVAAALGYTPYNAANPSGYISGITSGMVTGALGFTPYNATNPNAYISGITGPMVTTALGFTPYNATNPSAYITSAALTPYAPLAGATFSGNVGVNITPDEKLHVNGAVHIEPVVPGTTTARLYNNSGTLMWNGVAVATGSSVSGTITKIPKFTAANALGDSVMSETSTGNVGIGAAAGTTVRLSINGGATFATAARINQGFVGQNGLTFAEVGTDKWTLYTDTGFRVWDEVGGVDCFIIDAANNVKAREGTSIGVQRDSDGALISKLYGDRTGASSSTIGRWEVAGGATPIAQIRVGGTDTIVTAPTLTTVAGELVSNPGYANVKQFGAKGDYNEATGTGTDDTTAIQAAIAAAGYKGVYFPKGYYKITAALTCGTGKSLNMMGDGPNHSHICLVGTVNALRFTGVRNDRDVDTLVVRGLRFSANSGIAGYGIYASWVNGTSVSNLNTFAHAIIENCHFGQGTNASAFTYCVRLDGGKDSRISNCMFNNYVWTGGTGTLNGLVNGGIGVYLSASTGEAGVTDIDISKCIFDKTMTGVYGVDKLEGIRVYDCSFVGGLQGVTMDLTAHTAGGPYVNIDRCHFQTSEWGISLNGVMQSFITNNLIYSYTHQTGHDNYWGVRLIAKAAVYKSDITVANNVFVRADPTSFTSGYAVSCEGNSLTNLLSHVTIHNNRFGNGYNWSQSVYLDGFTANITAVNNVSDIGDSYLDNGTGNVIIPRLELGAANSGGTGYRMVRTLN